MILKARWLWIVLLALGLRLGAAFVVQGYLDHVAQRQFLIPGDADGYWQLGCQLASGEEFSLYAPPRRVMRMPGFPWLLAGTIALCGESLFAARIMLACVGAGACGLVYGLGCRLFNERVGCIAGCLAAVSPPLIVFSVELLSETPFGAAMVGSLWLMATLLTGPSDESSRTRLRLALITGVVIAIATYMRPTWILAAPAFAAVHVARDWWQRRALAVVEATCVMLGLGLALAPWTIRNWQVTGHFIPTTLWVGPSLYDGLHPGATGDSDMQFFEDDRLLEQMSEYDMDREYRRRAWAFAAENPGRVIELGFIKLARYWSPIPNAMQFRSWWMCLGIGAFSVPMLGLALWGAVQRRSDVVILLLTCGPVLYFAVVHAVFIGSIRYRLPAEYPLLILTAIGWVSWQRKPLADAHPV